MNIYTNLLYIRLLVLYVYDQLDRREFSDEWLL